MNFEYHHHLYQIERYPVTQDKSLQPWSSADVHMLNYLTDQYDENPRLMIANDRFGFLSCVCHEGHPSVIVSHKSHEKALLKNAERNSIDIMPEQILTPLSAIDTCAEVVLIRMPKSLDQFTLLLHQISQSLSDEAVVVCGFMTKYFTPAMVTVAEQFFDKVSQSRAYKKSRLLILKHKKLNVSVDFIHTVSYSAEKTFKQYFGVFSADHIDPATRFLIDHLDIRLSDQVVLDLASGNGVLGHAVREKNSVARIHLMDDAFLAVESSKFNLPPDNVDFHYEDDLSWADDEIFDVVVSNPPFHFEHEVTSEVTIGLFADVHRALKDGGRFQLVANKHLNYNVVLKNIFQTVEIVSSNKKFIILSCVK